MKKAIQISLIILIGVPLSYLIIIDKFTPIGNYMESSKEMNISNIEVSTKGYKQGAGYLLYYIIIHSKEMDRYFVVLYISQKRNIGVPPGIPQDIEELTIVVNSNLLNNPEYGTAESPVPIMNYKLDNEYVFDPKQYEYNVQKYLAYRRFINFKNE